MSSKTSGNVRIAKSTETRKAGKRRIALLLGCLFSVTILLAALAGCGGAQEQIQCQETEQAQDQETVTLDDYQKTGNTIGLSPSEASLEKARREGKPVLLNFHSTKCSPCIEIERIINQVKPDYEGRVEFVVVDVYDQAEQSLCNNYNIQTIPTTVFLDAVGQVTEGYIGVIDAASMRQMLDRLIGKT